MAADTFENPLLRASWNAQKGCVELRWKSEAQGEAFRSAIALMRRHGSSRLLTQDTLLQVVGTEARSARPDGLPRSHGPNEAAEYLAAVGW